MDVLRDVISNVSLYEVKAAVRKAQNVVMNYTEMEAKVREATNNEPWGASSTLMNEIASGTYNYQLLNEIMLMIYKRFLHCCVVIGGPKQEERRVWEHLEPGQLRIEKVHPDPEPNV